MRPHPEFALPIEQLADLKKMARFSYESIPPHLRLGTHAEERITLYKGATRSRQNTGFLSHALECMMLKNIFEARKIIEGDNLSAIKQLLDKHTAGDSFSPFISATPTPQLAQMFAPYDSSERVEYTIYQLKVTANRCTYVYPRTELGFAAREVVVLGIIFPDEIEAFKRVNRLEHSELFEEDPIFGGMVRELPDPRNIRHDVREPDNWEMVKGRE